MEPLFEPVSKKKPIIFLILGILALLIFYYLLLSPPSAFPPGSIFTIEEGTSLRALSSQLKENNLIRSRVLFESSIIIFGGEKHIIPADYFLEYKLPVFELARRIAKGERHLSPVKVTIPEGFTIEEIADLLAVRLTKLNKDNFREWTKGKEGYLFPDSYFFFTNDGEERAISALESNFEKKVTPLRADIALSGHTEKEIITMASIIEGEAKGDGDRELISGILWQRIKIGMVLQADAAPITYKERGLPFSPINNPGLASIVAAIHPKTSPYLYYLHDSLGNIHYAKTFEEHKQNKFKYLK